ncbi:MAG TPA: hypothetical protein VFL27_13445 [Candidatus Dormibacteraeota bacterium]|nr:hypothetical protein [Candidatus Dormibacteraeota bacterium]
MASVFNRTVVGAARAAVSDPSTLKDSANLVGQTEHFFVYADPALGTDGRQDAQVVLADCEDDYARVSTYFGGIDAGPFAVVLFANPNGAYHMSCAATDLFCDAVTGPANGELSEFLNVAEFVEVFEAVQGGGWDCGKSNGEGLSRVLATDLHPAQLDGFATAPAWLDSRRHDYVDTNFDSDTSALANGCSVLFLNWLRFQLGFSWAQIVGAAGPTLGSTYSQLTGKNDGFKQFSSLLESHFPKGRASGLHTDNPFPL